MFYVLIISNFKSISNYYSEFFKYFLEKVVILRWREKIFHGGWTNVQPIDANFKGKSNGRLTTSENHFTRRNRRKTAKFLGWHFRIPL